ncbi:MAG: DUF503 family protein [candidate division Zixibacteria bacterium]|nr:DUF503 family protein [candidate division Zixibacteria bacterium]
MVVGLLSLEIFIPESNSLKTKRMILRSIKDKIRGDFNVSIAEVDNQNLWQRALLGVSIVSNDKKYANRVLNKIVDKLSTNGFISIIDYQIELL